MNTWPTLKEWIQFGGIVTLEVVIVFAVAKLAALRIRSAQWRRALWQMVLVAMFIIVAGELSGVRDLARMLERRPKTEASPQRKVIVSIKEPDVSFPLSPAAFPTTQTPFAFTPSRMSLWQQHAAWPALAWLAGAILVLCRGLLAQITALVFRLSCRRIGDEGLNERVERIRGHLGIRRRVWLLESSRAVAPFTFGIWKPVIVLPCRFTETFTADQQEVALAHELAHVAGFDSAWRNIADFVCAVLWWHPFAWLAKRELAHSAELAADESSLLFADGPSRLAECLVACAKQVRRPALVSWLGMDGDGFRSALGKRVARLLQLQPNRNMARPVPWYLRCIAPLLCVGLLWTGMAVAMKSSQPRYRAWQNSLLGSVFAAAAETQPLTKGSPPNKTNVAVSPGAPNKTSREAEPKSDAPKLTSKPQQEIFAKLRNIRLSEWGPIDNLPLSEVIRSLSDQMRRRDPESKGVNFMISQNAVGNKEPEVDAAGLPIEPGPAFDVNATTVRLGTMLKDISCEDALNVLVTIADRPIQYSIEDFAVVISPKSRARQPLHARFFRLDPNTLQQGLDAVIGPKTKNTAPRVGQLSRTNGVTEVMRAADVIPALQRWFKSLGLEMTEPGKSIFFNDRLGMLMVRGTIADLDTIETALQFLNMSPPQLTLRVKVMEVPIIPGAHGPAFSFESEFLRRNVGTNGSNNQPTLTGILTDEQFRELVRNMEKTGGADLLSAPDVTTISGRRAQIKMVNVKYIVTDLDVQTNNVPGESFILPISEPFELGPIVDVVPYVETDGYTIAMTVMPKLKEFLGYEDPLTVKPAIGGAAQYKGVSQPVPLPQFRVREVTTTARVFDGQTLVVGTGKVRNIEKQQLPDGTTKTNVVDKELFFFITPRLIDPAGNPLHSNEELRKAHKTVPAQTNDRISQGLRNSAEPSRAPRN